MNIHDIWTRMILHHTCCFGLPRIPSPSSSSSTLASLWRFPCPTLSWCGLGWAHPMSPDPLHPPASGVELRTSSGSSVDPIPLATGIGIYISPVTSAWNHCGTFWDPLSTGKVKLTCEKVKLTKKTDASLDDFLYALRASSVWRQLNSGPIQCPLHTPTGMVTYKSNSPD